MTTFYTQKPLVVFGATGLLSSDFIFMSCVERFSPCLVLQGGSVTRLQGLKDELEESGFGDLSITITTDIDEACSYGGYALYARSVRAAKQTREEMLLDNAPMAKEVGESIRRQGVTFERIVCVSNPSDLIGLTILVHSGQPESSVMSLSALDTLRFRRSLMRRFGVGEEALEDAYTLGSHDQSMAILVDDVKIKGRSLRDSGLSADEISVLESEVRFGGINIYKLRGHTAYQSPAVLCLRMLEADDRSPFLYPSARYHHSQRYPYAFGSLPTVIDSLGCRHLPIALTSADMMRLDIAYKSITDQRNVLIEHRIIPPTEEWSEILHQTSNLVTGK